MSKPSTIPELRAALAPLCGSSPVRAVVCSWDNARKCAAWIEKNRAASSLYQFRLRVAETLEDCYLYRVEDGEATPLLVHACFPADRPESGIAVTDLEHDAPEIVRKNPELDVEKITFVSLHSQRQFADLASAVEAVRGEWYSEFGDRSLVLPARELQSKFDARMSA